MRIDVVSETPEPPARGERRFVTVLFADVCGSSEHAERLDAEEYAELLWRFRALAREIVPRHGGSIARLQGDGLLALFGHLRTQEDDGRRAAEAAIALHAAVAALKMGKGASAAPLALHSGIHAGLVLLIEGDIELGRFDVVGEVPNTASRLCSMAGLDEVLISAESLGPMAHFFTTVALGHLSIRGRSELLNVLRVARRTSLTRRIDASAQRGVVPLAGRKGVLQELAAVAQRCRDGGSATVVLRGEPGIGKTRLLDEFLGSLEPQGWQVLRGFCEQGLSAEPLQPFIQMLRGESPPPDGARALALLSERAQQAPLVLAIDDWQWADDASRQLLQHLLEKPPSVFVLLAKRAMADDDVSLADVLTVELQPLSEAEAASTIEAWLPAVNPFVAQDIWRQSGGSPLFIEELCQAIAAGRDLKTAPRAAGVAWINALVASRLELLPEEQRECLRLAAVIGPHLEQTMLGQLIGDGRHDALQAVLEGGGFLVAGAQPGWLRFRHALTRDAVYATVPLEQRRALHLQVATLLRSDGREDAASERLESLAYHFHAAQQAEPAAEFAEAAGNKALAAMALDRARAQYGTALQALDSLPAMSAAVKARWCALAQKLGQTCVFDALDVDPMLPLFERAASLAAEIGDENAMARAHYWLGYVHYGKGQPQRSVHHCQAALRHAEASQDLRLQAQVRATLGQALASAGRYDEALPLLRLAYESKRQNSRPGSGTAIGSAYTLARTGYTLGDIGRFDEAHACFEQALALLGDVMHAVKASVLELHCVVYLWQGRWAEAEAIGLAGADVALRCRSRFNTEMGRALAACATWASSQSSTALQTLRSSTQWIEARGGAVSTSLNYGWLVEATLAQGLHAEARRHAARLLLRARAQDIQGAAQGLRALAIDAARRGRPDLGARWLTRADAFAQRRGSAREMAMNTLARAEMALILGREREAVAVAASAARSFEDMAMVSQRLQALDLLERLDAAPHG